MEQYNNLISSNKIEFVNQTKTHLFYNNNKYALKSASKNYYVCIFNNTTLKKKCNAAIKIHNHQIKHSAEQQKHNHEPYCDCETEILIFMIRLKDKIEYEGLLMDAAKEIYHSFYTQLTHKYSVDTIAIFWQSWNKIAGTLRYRNRENRIQNNQLLAADDLSVYANAFRLPNQEQFLKYDNLDFKNRILIFYSRSASENIAKAEILHFDGTFKSVPQEFTHLLIVHAYINRQFYPSAFILLSNKEAQTYISSLSKLKELIEKEGKTLQVKVCFSDFEYSLQLGLNTVFVGVELKGCWFHFNKCLTKKLFGYTGLKTTFYINVEFKKWFRRFGTLALVPLNYLEEAWNIILDSKPKISNCDDYDKSIINFLEYFVNNWLIGRFGKNTSPLIWNVFEYPGPRTNNHCEGFNSKLNKSVHLHPNVFELVTALINNENVNESIGVQIGFNTSHSMRAIDIQKENKLNKIQADFREKKINFATYFELLTIKVTMPYSRDISQESIDAIVLEELTSDPCDAQATLTEKIPRIKLPHIPDSITSIHFFSRINILDNCILPICDRLQAEPLVLTNAPEKRARGRPRKRPLETAHENVNKKIGLQPNDATLGHTAASSIVESSFDSYSSLSNTASLSPLFTIRQKILVKNNEANSADDDVFYLKTNENFEPKRKPQLMLRILRLYEAPIQLDNFHIDAYLENLREFFPSYGLPSPQVFIDTNFRKIYYNPTDFTDNHFVCVVHLFNHWVCISNFNNWIFPDCPIGKWFIYDSLQDPKSYLPAVKNIIHRFTNDMDTIVYYPQVKPQTGILDCGLFALGYAHSLCLDINPSILSFNQEKFREHFNDFVLGCTSDLFPHCLNIGGDSVNYAEFDLSTV